MIKLLLIAGFLGAGKTTLLKKLLEDFADKRVGVIVNDFGKVNIDARLVEKDGIQMAELSNGSIFCACIKENFLASLVEMSSRELDYVFIEASGLADPANMLQILQTIDPLVDQPYDYLGSLCIIDAEHFLGLYELLPALDHQVRYSSVAIINKLDLVDETKLEKIRAKIVAVNPHISILQTSYCAIDIHGIVEKMTNLVEEAGESSNTPETKPKTFTLAAHGLIAEAELNSFLLELAPAAYRIKGFVRSQKAVLEVSAVGEHISIAPWHDANEQTELVVISAVGIKMLSLIMAAIEKHLPGKLYLL